MMRLLIAALVLLGPSIQSNGRIAGHVATTGDPGVRLARAYVSLIGTDSTTRRLTMTRSDGTFVFDDVPAGAYVVEAGRLPHLAKAERISLKPGQRIDNVTFRLKRSGVIAGQTFDEQGQPARDTRVSAQRIRYDRGGVMTTAPTGYSGVTDRSGRFRIHGLAPGAYVVATSPAVLPFGTPRPLTDTDLDRALQGTIAPRPVAQPPTQPGAFELRMSPVFVPGVTSAGAATVFVIDDGTEHLGVNAHLLPTASGSTSTLASVTGSVVGLDGQPVDAQVTLALGQVALPSGAQYQRGSFKASRFVFEALMPGPIRIDATLPDSNLRATAEFTLTAGQTSEVVLRLSRPIEITGRTIHAGAGKAPMIVVKGLTSAVKDTGIEADDSGAFRFSLYPGRYVIAGGSSVTLDGRDVTDRVIEVKPDTSIKSLIVSFSDDTQDISGRVLNSDGAGVTTVTMVAFSTDETDWFHQSRRIVKDEPSSDGRYQLGGPGATSLPAGDYYLAAVADLSPDEHYNPAFLRTLSASAIRITIAPGQRVVQDVRVR